MDSEIEIIPLQKRNYKKSIISLFLVGLFLLTVFFGYRAYSMTKKIIVAKSEGASPYLSSSDNIAKTDISKFEKGDRRINVLLLGMGGENHPGGNLTDTIQVISIDPKNKEAAMISIPRDFYVSVKGFGSFKINSVYSLNEDGYYDIKASDEKTPEEDREDTSRHINLTKKVVSDLLGVPIHYAVVVNFDSFKEVVDILGGVDVDVKKIIYDPYFPDQYVEEYEEFFIDKGLQHLDGETALKYARSRETTSDFDRSARQQEIMIAIKDKAIKSMSVKKMSQVINVLSKNIKTDLQLSEINELYDVVKNIDSRNIETKVLDDSEDGLIYADQIDGLYVLIPNDSTYKELHSFISQFFKDPLIAEEKAKIKITNGQGNEYGAKKLASDLASVGYDVIFEKAVEPEEYSKTFIYDYSNDKKKATIGFLKDYLGDIPVLTLDDESEEYDIEIVVGDDY